jgi:hypothetical protein
VRCDPGSADGETEVTVVYDVTSLGTEGAEFVERLQDDYGAFIGGWRPEIIAALAAGG